MTTDDTRPPQRYSLVTDPPYSSYLELDPDGRWVLFEDMEEILDAERARIADLETEVRKWKAIATQYNKPGTTFGRGTRP